MFPVFLSDMSDNDVEGSLVTIITTPRHYGVLKPDVVVIIVKLLRASYKISEWLNLIRCKLELNSRIIEQTMTLNYLGVEITSHHNLYKVTTNQVRNAAVVSGALKNIWRNKYLRKEANIINN
ncbi:hypothetical protein M0802_001115 [Mischocyttarus mexicanus]|nr:hypothetical protein M0802_001115 [Mischocyttarus mexicanus]